MRYTLTLKTDERYSRDAGRLIGAFTRAMSRRTDVLECVNVCTSDAGTLQWTTCHAAKPTDDPRDGWELHQDFNCKRSVR